MKTLKTVFDDGDCEKQSKASMLQHQWNLRQGLLIQMFNIPRSRMSIHGISFNIIFFFAPSGLSMLSSLVWAKKMLNQMQKPVKSVRVVATLDKLHELKYC